jgi:RHS repeat-associated protein
VTQRTYTHDPGPFGGVLSVYDGTSAKYYEPDALGSTDALTDDAQAVTDRWAYRAFGSAVHVTGSDPTPFTWVGRLGYYADAETGLYQLGNGTRYYDSHTAQFLSRDPIEFSGGDSDLYRYAANRPVALIDPSGLFPRLPSPPRPGPFFEYPIDPAPAELRQFLELQLALLEQGCGESVVKTEFPRFVREISTAIANSRDKNSDELILSLLNHIIKSGKCCEAELKTGKHKGTIHEITLQDCARCGSLVEKTFKEAIAKVTVRQVLGQDVLRRVNQIVRLLDETTDITTRTKLRRELQALAENAPIIIDYLKTDPEITRLRSLNRRLDFDLSTVR